MNTFLNFLSTYGLFLGLPLLFLVIVAWVYRPGAKRAYRADARIPFAEDVGKPGNGRPMPPGAGS